jgi:hypothetical protein
LRVFGAFKSQKAPESQKQEAREIILVYESCSTLEKFKS